MEFVTPHPGRSSLVCEIRPARVEQVLAVNARKGLAQDAGRQKTQAETVGHRRVAVHEISPTRVLLEMAK